MYRIRFFLLFATITIVVLKSQDRFAKTPIIFIYDASGSMWGQIEGKTKKQIGTDVLTATIHQLDDDRKIGFVAYGHRTKGDCEDVEFLVDVENGRKANVIETLIGIKPLGKTPLAYSALQVIDQLRTIQSKATIILITDGIETCDGNICEVIKEAKEEGIEFQLHIVGFGLKNENTEQLECAALAGDGKYYDAEDASSLSTALEEVTQMTVNEPVPNFTVYALKNGEPVDAWVKAYDVEAKRKPISVRTYQDTGYFYLPVGTYNFEATPLEGTDVQAISLPNIQSVENKMGHQTISFDGGTFALTTTNNGENWDCVVKVIDQSGKVAASTRTYKTETEVEVNPGVYNVTISALAIEGLEIFTEIENQIIEPGGITNLNYEFSSGYFEVFTKIRNDNIDATIRIKEVNSNKGVAASRTYTKGSKFTLSPGTYEVQAKPLGVNKDRAIQTFRIEIRKGEKISRTLQF